MPNVIGMDLHFTSSVKSLVMLYSNVPELTIATLFLRKPPNKAADESTPKMSQLGPVLKLFKKLTQIKFEHGRHFNRLMGSEIASSFPQLKQLTLSTVSLHTDKCRVHDLELSTLVGLGCLTTLSLRSALITKVGCEFIAASFPSLTALTISKEYRGTQPTATSVRRD